jgi:hypothetical protein
VKPRGCESRGKSRDARCGASLEAQPGEGAVDMLQRLSAALPSPHPLLAVLPETSRVISSRILDVLFSHEENTVVLNSASVRLLEKGAVVDAYPHKTPYNITLVVLGGSVACLALGFDSIHSDVHIQSSAATTCFFARNKCADALILRGVQPSVLVIEKGGVVHLRAGTYFSLVSLENSGIFLFPIPGTALICEGKRQIGIGFSGVFQAFARRFQAFARRFPGVCTPFPGVSCRFRFQARNRSHKTNK